MVLLTAYTRDAAAADRRYKDQRLRVTGVVAEEPALAFEGTGIQNRPVAVLGPAREGELAGLRSGHGVTLDCLGNGHSDAQKLHHGSASSRTQPLGL
ncbi:OB-fold protein [Stenotrophomonas geniculata]|uniref:OB-fold protein n=1 Tax=Stenotrophomonas geniculata TaxID=86188 RepID=UPI00178479B4